MAVTKSGGLSTGFGGFGKNVVASNKSAAATVAAQKAATPVAFSGAVGTAFKSGATNLTNKGSGGLQAQAAQVATQPTSYSSGTKVVANTPAISPQIGVNSLNSQSSGAMTAGTSPMLAPSAPSVGTYGSAIQGSVATGANPTTGLYDTATTDSTGAPKVTATTGEQTPKLSPGEQFLKDNGIPTLEKPQSITDEYYKSDAYRAQQQAMEQKNNTQNAINAITTRLNTDLANLRGVGAREGVTEAVYGQQTSEIIREANNQLLPLQAQLAADQGNLELATSTLNTWATMRQKDLENEYNYKKSLRDELVKFATDEQKAKLDAVNRASDRKFELDKLAIQFDYQKKLKAIDNVGGVGGADAPLYNGLNSATATAVRGQVSAFKSEPLITNFQTIQEGRNFAKSIPTNTKNPADDQALIYSLAKALDPGSVVREGEYATAQKYSQSWIKAYGSGISQALAGTGFLSQTARENIKKTIETKYESSKRSYDTVSKQYEEGINNLTGRNDGSKFLRSYITPDVQAPQNTVNITPQDNALFNSVVTPTSQNNVGSAAKSQFGIGLPGFNLFSFFK